MVVNILLKLTMVVNILLKLTMFVDILLKLTMVVNIFLWTCCNYFLIKYVAEVGRIVKDMFLVHSDVRKFASRFDHDFDYVDKVCEYLANL